MTRFIQTCLLFVVVLSSYAQQSSARIWNETLLECIRLDLARPTVHSRNLYHHSMAMYDAWAIIDGRAEPHFLGKTLGTYSCSFSGFTPNKIKSLAITEAISYASYRLMKERFKHAPRIALINHLLDSVFYKMSGDTNFVSVDYSTGDSRAFGNFIAQQVLSYGLTDGANEVYQYANQYYKPISLPLAPDLAGNPDITDPNRWQQLLLNLNIDQSGNVLGGTTIPFLGAEWGRVVPYSFQPSQLIVKHRDSNDYWFYEDPGIPLYLDYATDTVASDLYKWAFELVAVWSSHLSSIDTTRWDISPNTMGNVTNLPKKFEDFPAFYDLDNKQILGKGYSVNPFTGLPYEVHEVKRGDFTRALAEFWADGPSSETPPGHWFALLNYVSDQPECEHKFEGTYKMKDRIMWDVYSYMLMGGAMHDVAVSIWGIKGYYDYLRPISALRYLADQGQSSDVNLPRYNINGIKLVPNHVEMVTASDPLAMFFTENIGKIKVRAWKGPDYIPDPNTTEAGVDWILMENWWPYQRPSFVTPPFAGYLSGHSTFSRAAAEILTRLTGDAYFPRGLGKFEVLKNEFLVFEEGPSETFTLQWATYRDAAAQSGLSRIWGGIHPPTDDVPGRIIGERIGNQVFDYAKPFLFPDKDNDGFHVFADKDDNDSTIYPGAPELCDQKDNDGNQLVDDGLVFTNYFLDADADGFGDVNYRIATCLSVAPVGYVIDSTDCADSNAAIHPFAKDIFDNDIDEDCNGVYPKTPILLYPNPTSGIVYVQNFITEKSVFKMYDRLGALIISQDIGAAGITEINLGKLRHGLFIVQIENLKGDVLHRQKLVLTDR